MNKTDRILASDNEIIIELAESIGIKAYRKLVEDYGGSHIYVSKTETVLRELRNNEIYS